MYFILGISLSFFILGCVDFSKEETPLIPKNEPPRSDPASPNPVKPKEPERPTEGNGGGATPVVDSVTIIPTINPVAPINPTPTIIPSPSPSPIPAAIPSPAAPVIPPPIVQTFSPTSGSILGGERLTVKGLDFLEGIQVMIGPFKCEDVVFRSSTMVDCKIPEGTSGFHRVTVKNPDEKQASSGWFYLYAATGSSISNGGHESRRLATAVWTSSEMLIWGGDTSLGISPTGLAYLPPSNTWKSLAKAPNEVGAWYHSAVWSGKEMIVWGGKRDHVEIDLNSGGRYDPSSDTWKVLSTVNAPQRRSYHTAVSTGNKMIVWGGVLGDVLNSGGAYDLTYDRWSSTSMTDAPLARMNHTAIWTGKEMIIWGGSTGTTILNSGAAYSPDTDRWRTLSMDLYYGNQYMGKLPARWGHTAIWTGTEMIVWGGMKSSGSSDKTNTGFRYDPILDRWYTLTVTNAPKERSGHTSVWTGTHLLVFGGADPMNVSLREGGLYNPKLDQWSCLTAGCAGGLGNVLLMNPRTEHVGVWTGLEFIVWGGVSSGTWEKSGYRIIP